LAQRSTGVTFFATRKTCHSLSNRELLKMNKRLLLKQIVASLNETLALLEKAARASHAEATHESSKAESKYDTRGLEAAYLAGGQARQAREILDSIKLYQSLPLRDFAPGDPIDLTAVVELDAGGSRSIYFIGPRSGGLELQYEGKEVVVITPQSPLGQNLVGKKAGDRWSEKLGGSTTKYSIIKVS
jgi:hypothetical protein